MFETSAINWNKTMAIGGYIQTTFDSLVFKAITT